jgi:hypothetical protein
MLKLVKVVQARVLDGHRLWLRFSDGREGVRDFSDILAEGGPMVEPLRDPAFFARVFVEYGVPSWPNGYDVDAIALHREMEAAGLLSQPAEA